MIDLSTVRDQTLGYRRAAAQLITAEAQRADVVPPTWNNNLRWHAGHLVTTPHLLTFGLMGESLRIPSEYRRWFGKGTSPADWAGEPVPAVETLVAELVDTVEVIFDAFEERAGEAFPRPYESAALGIALRTPAQALTFSLSHDALHVGMIQALKRSLAGMEVGSAAQPSIA